MEKKGLNKLDYIDNLKVALTCLVVAHHAGQPYGGSGGFWVIKSEQTTNVGVFFAVTAAIFLTLFFMISASLAMNAVNRMTRGLANELNEYNVSVVALCPGWI